MDGPANNHTAVTSGPVQGRGGGRVVGKAGKARAVARGETVAAAAPNKRLQQMLKVGTCDTYRYTCM